MVVQFFRLVIKGTDETVLSNIKNWFDVRIENNDLDDNVGTAKLATNVREDDSIGEGYIFEVNMYIKSTVDKEKYTDIIKGHFANADKSTFTKAFVDKYDNCSHDSDNPQPCVMTRVLEWSAE